VRVFPAKVTTILILAALPVHAGVVVEQIEGLNTLNTNEYAPIDFQGNATVTETSGIFSGITFHAVDPNADTGTYSGHAYAVGQEMYGTGAAGNLFVTDVYSADADSFIPGVVQPQSATSSTAPLPGHFSSGVQVVNNSYVDNENSNLETLRRWDFMIQRDNVTFVAAAAIDTGQLAGAYLDWSAYNSLAVSSDQTSFSPTGSPGKAHADVWYVGEASFATGTVSGFAAGLYGNAQAAGQAAAQNDVMIRSLLMTGADKVNYSRQTANNLSGDWGAGEADFSNSLAALQGGQESIQSLGNTGAVTGVLATSPKGWGFGPVQAGGQSVVMFHSSGGITGITASMNWDVTSSSTATTLDTTDAGVIFPQLDLELRPLISSGGQYQLGASLGDATLQSDASNDNVQYLYSTSALPAGNYAFVITGDPSLTPNVGFSYIVNTNATTTQWAQSVGGSWNSSANWSNGIPNGPGAQANFLTTPTGLTIPGSIALNGNQTVGEITFNDTQSYAIVPGTGGALTIDDTGDAGGVYPSISAISGNQSISVPVSLAAGLNVNVNTGSILNINGNLTGVGGLIVGGQGTLNLSGIDNYGDTNVTGGTLAVYGVVLSNNVTVAASANLNVNGSLSPSAALTADGSVKFGANSGDTVVARTLGSLSIGSGGTVALAANANSNRTVLVTGALTIAGTSADWTGKLDLNDNDMIVQNGNLTNIVSQIKEGFNASGGYWNGAGGIVSTSAATATNFLTTLGAIQNDNGDGTPLYGSGAPYGLFDGQNPGEAAVLVKYTYYGDADLNGVVDGRDYSRIDIGFREHLTGWVNGDFNYDGVVDGSDYSLIDNAYNFQGANLSALAMEMTAAPASSIDASVPEPGSLCLLGGGFAAGMWRRGGRTKLRHRTEYGNLWRANPAR
jgi:hypothetical protein